MSRYHRNTSFLSETKVEMVNAIIKILLIIITCSLVYLGQVLSVMTVTHGNPLFVKRLHKSKIGLKYCVGAHAEVRVFAETREHTYRAGIVSVHLSILK